jgi:hypothetical protein
LITKKSKRSTIVKKLDQVFSEWIRRRDAVGDIATCVTCGKKDHWKSLQCGHFQSRKHYNTRWDETNCQVQCAGCNVFRYGEQYKFGVYLNQTFGVGTSDELHYKASQTVKFSNAELIDMIDYYKKLLQTLK